MQQSLISLMKNFPKDADAAIITSPENRLYFTKLHSSAGTLIVTKKTAYFIIDFRYYDKAKSTISDFEVILQGDNLMSQIIELLKKNQVKNIAIETDFVSVSQYHKYCESLKNYNVLSDSELSDTIRNLRAVKSEDELSYIMQAQSITDRTFTHMLNFIKQGQTELFVKLELEYTLKKLGAEELAFDSIVVSGINSSLPHGNATDKELQQGDFLTMDFGAKFNGYCSDMTRTVAIGNVDDEQIKVYQTVLQSQIMAIDAIKIEKKYCDIDKVARDYIYANGYEGCFGHGLGHSLGIDIHESPNFNTKCDSIIQPGTILTVEPGIYISQKFGVRIEDMVYITDNKVVNLTKSQKNLISL